MEFQHSMSYMLEIISYNEYVINYGSTLYMFKNLDKHQWGNFPVEAQNIKKVVRRPYWGTERTHGEVYVLVINIEDSWKTDVQLLKLVGKGAQADWYTACHSQILHYPPKPCFQAQRTLNPDSTKPRCHTSNGSQHLQKFSLSVQ